MTEDTNTPSAEARRSTWIASLRKAGVQMPERLLERIFDLETINLPLMKEIEFAGKTYTALEVKAPRTPYLRTWPNDLSAVPFGQLVNLGARLAGVDDKVVEQMHPNDTQALVEIVTGFLLLFQVPTGVLG